MSDVTCILLQIESGDPAEAEQLTAPKGTPNVLLVLIDDMGFGQPAALGGPIKMPTLERIAQGGLRYNRFHTTAVYNTTRAALLNGNNAHTVNVSEIAETSTGFRRCLATTSAFLDMNHVNHRSNGTVKP